MEFYPYLVELKQSETEEEELEDLLFYPYLVELKPIPIGGFTLNLLSFILT